MYNKFKNKKKNCSSWERTIINYRRYLYTIFKFMCTEKVAKCEPARFHNSLSKWFKTLLKSLCTLLKYIICLDTSQGNKQSWKKVVAY